MDPPNVKIDPVVSQTLIQVQDALRRIQFNAYGACIACGKPIELYRLEEAPWTPYCVEDQSKYCEAGALKQGAAVAN